MQLLEFRERGARIERKFYKRGASAGEKKENESIFAGLLEQLENRATSLETFGGGNRMAGANNSPPGKGVRRNVRDDQNAVERKIGRQNVLQALRHRKGSLAKGDCENLAIGVEIESLAADLKR